MSSTKHTVVRGDPAPSTTSDVVTGAELATLVAGRVLAPGEPGFDDMVSAYNIAAVSIPRAVVEVNDANDVAAVMRYAAARGLDVVARSTGHGAVPFTRPTVLIRTGRLDELTIRSNCSARVGAGVRWQEVLDAAATSDQGCLAGASPGVGVVGFLTGGGIGPVSRTFGFGSDQVTAFDVVTGDAVTRRVTADEHPDLFWGLRGGKGALGVVTAVEFNLIPVRQVYGGCLWFDGTDSAEVAHAWRTWSQALPDEATTSMAIMRLPDMPSVPRPLAGRCAVAIRFAWVGEHDAGAQRIKSLRINSPAILGDMSVLTYAGIGSIHADPVDPIPLHEDAQLIRELPAEAIDALLGVAGPSSDCSLMGVELRLLGGALGRHTDQPSAQSHRDAAYHLLAVGVAAPAQLQTTTEHVAAVMDAVGPWSHGGRQPNFGPSLDPRALARCYDDASLRRLASLVARYDHDGVVLEGRAIRAAAAECASGRA